MADESFFHINYAWNQGKPSSVDLHLESPMDLQVNFITASHPLIPEQELICYFNGVLIKNSNIKSEIKSIELFIDRQWTQGGRNRLKWVFSNSIHPYQAQGYDLNIGLTGIKTPVRIEVESRSLWMGLLSRIIIDRQNYALNKRGYNVATIDPISGKVLSRECFDVFHAQEEANRFGHFLDRLLPGTIVAVSLKDIGVPYAWMPARDLIARIEEDFSRTPEFQSRQEYPLLELETVAVLPDGEVLEHENKAHGSYENMNAYIAWLKRLPEATRINLYVKGNRELDSLPDLSEQFSRIGAIYHKKLAAVIGVKDAWPGTAVQSYAPAGHEHLVVGGFTDRKSYAAAVACLVITPLYAEAKLFSAVAK